jgi:hypothetical protein
MTTLTTVTTPQPTTTTLPPTTTTDPGTTSTTTEQPTTTSTTTAQPTTTSTTTAQPTTTTEQPTTTTTLSPTSTTTTPAPTTSTTFVFPTNTADANIGIVKTMTNCFIDTNTDKYCCSFQLVVNNGGSVTIPEIDILDYTQSFVMLNVGDEAPVNNIQVSTMGTGSCSSALLPIIITEMNVIQLVTCTDFAGGQVVTVTFNFCFDEEIDSKQLVNSGAAYDPQTDFEIQDPFLLNIGKQRHAAAPRIYY